MLSILKKFSILYVEDEPKIQLSIAEYLGNYFDKIYLASSGKDALELFTMYQPDVLLLDIGLPDIDGLVVAEEVRKINTTSRIIMLTAYTEKEKLLKATELKLTKYLVKPVSPKTFKETLISLAKELAENPSQFLRLGESLVWNQDNSTLHNDKGLVRLPEKQHRLLKLFVERKGRAVTYEKIILTVWDNTYEKDISLDSVKNQVSQLRKYLPTNCIVSVYGEGYMLN